MMMKVKFKLLARNSFLYFVKLLLLNTALVKKIMSFQSMCCNLVKRIYARVKVIIPVGLNMQDFLVFCTLPSVKQLTCTYNFILKAHNTYAHRKNTSSSVICNRISTSTSRINVIELFMLVKQFFTNATKNYITLAAQSD